VHATDGLGGWAPAAGAPKSLAQLVELGSDGALRVRHCTVVEYRAESNLCCVEVLGANGQPSTMTVPRLHVCFLAESPATFAQRFMDAHQQAQQALQRMQYQLFLESMPTDDIPLLTAEQVNRMLAYALNSKKLKDKLMDTSPLINEINLEFARTMNRIIFERAARSASTDSAAAIVRLPNLPPPDQQHAAPQTATVAVPEYDFPEQFGEFSFRTMLTKPEVISALNKIRVECNKVLKMSFLAMHYTKSSRLEELEQAQAQASDQVGNYLKDTWTTTLKAIIKTSFKDVGEPTRRRCAGARVLGGPCRLGLAVQQRVKQGAAHTGITCMGGMAHHASHHTCSVTLHVNQGQHLILPGSEKLSRQEWRKCAVLVADTCSCQVLRFTIGAWCIARVCVPQDGLHMALASTAAPAVPYQMTTLAQSRCTTVTRHC
jgi:hypothetical protein